MFAIGSQVAVLSGSNVRVAGHYKSITDRLGALYVGNFSASGLPVADDCVLMVRLYSTDCVALYDISLMFPF